LTRFFLCALSFCICLKAESAREIVQRSLDLGNENLKAAGNYAYRERNESRTLDGSGWAVKTESSTYDVTLVDLSPYRRMIERDDKPLPEKDERKEQEKLRKIAEQRRKETREQRQARLAEHERKREQQRSTIREVLDAFDFRLAAEDHLEGRNQYVIEATPHPGYKARSRIAAYFPKLKGRLWIDRQDYHWVRIEAEVIDTISIGGIIVRLAKGSHLEAEQTRVNNEVWLPKRLTAEASARVALLKKFHGSLEITYSDYKKFQTDSRIVDH
jgi:hypothetical protein